MDADCMKKEMPFVIHSLVEDPHAGTGEMPILYL